MKKIIIGFSLLGVIGFVYYLLRVGFHSDLNDYPHDATVWGTVSDWAMVVVTATTAIVIWRTLRSQTKVEEVEVRRHLYSILPQFHILNADRANNPFASPPVTLVIACRENPIDDLALVDDSGGKVSMTTYPRGAAADPAFELEIGFRTPLPAYGTDQQINDTIRHIATFSFKDREGNKYKCEVKHGIKGYYLEPPVLIN